jgi:hypothetical protein
MTLYSWFFEESKKRKKLLGRKPKKLITETKYLESFTMWPVVKIIQGEQVTLPQKKVIPIKKDEIISSTSIVKAPISSVLIAKKTNNVF